MKKIILLITVLFAISLAKAQTTIADTLANLQVIANNKSVFVGKPFSVLLDSLKYKMVYFSPHADITSDISKETSTSFYFIDPESLEDFQSAYIKVFWEPYLNYAISDKIYDDYDGWSPQAEQFYRKGVIKKIEVSAKIVTTTLPPSDHWVVVSCVYKKVYLNDTELWQWRYEITKKFCENGVLGTDAEISYSTNSVPVEFCGNVE